MKFAAGLAIVLCSAMPATSAVITYECQFDYRIDLDGKTEEPFPLTFKIDTTSHRAFMEGNVGIVDVEFFVGDEALSFIEKVASGAIQTTTIARDGWAVHSRNTVLLGEIIAAQHFGCCVPE